MSRETHLPDPRSGRAGGIPPVAELVRRHDRDRFQSALFAPAARREPLLTLYAFNYEIARVREAVTQPVLGQMRLQWWREVVAAAFAGEPPRHHVVAEPLTAAIRDYALSRGCFQRLIDSRERDLAEEPPASLADLEDYAEGTSAPLVHLALEILGVRGPAAAETARDVGVAYALAGLLRAIPFHARAGRSYIPVDLAEQQGLDPRDYGMVGGLPALRAVSREIAQSAARHLKTARERRRTIPRSGLAAVLPAVIADRFLARLKRARYDPFAPELAAPDALQSWRLAIAALLSRF